MCDPLSMTALSIAGSAASAGMSYMGAQETNAANQKANDDWVATQRAAAAKANAADEAARQKSQAALGTSEDALSQQKQSAVQQQQASDLNTQMLAGTPAAGDNVQLLGQPEGGADTSVTKDMAGRVTDAARQAQGRIAALAGLTSYGSGYGGMGAAANSALADSGEQIKLQGDIRNGTNQVLGVTQQIQPVHYAAGSDIAGSLAGTLAGMAGKNYGQSLAKTA